MAGKDYVAEMAKMARRAADLHEPFNALFYARKKQGKTTLALSGGVEKTLVIDPEKGAWYKKKSNPYIVPISKWGHMEIVTKALATGRVSPKALKLGKSDVPFEYICVDGLTRINNFALKFVMKKEEARNLDRQPGFVQQRDYGKSGELMKEMMAQFHALPQSIIYTAQEKVKPLNNSFDDDDVDSEDQEVIVIPELPDAVRGAVNSLVDVIGRLYVVRLEVDGEMVARRRLRVGNHEGFDTGFRSEFNLPNIIDKPSIPKLQKLMREGKAA